MLFILLLPLLALLNSYLPIESIAQKIAFTSNQQRMTLLEERSQLLAERNTLSPQDQFAKWTKLNRKLDKLNDEIKLVESTMAQSKSKIKTYISRTLSVSYNIARFWYAKSVVVYLPKGLFPSTVDMFLVNFPLGTRGALNTFIWTSAVLCTVNVVIKGAKSIVKVNKV